MGTHGRYSIIRKIASGGMAEIYLAELAGSQGFKKQVVLKRIRPAFYADSKFKTMLIDEAHISMSLTHGNIVQVLDFGEAVGGYFLALELVDGWSFDQVLTRSTAAKHPLPPELALFVIAETGRALAYAHGMSLNGRALEIGHRDVSPQNILVSEHGQVKLADFGIAKAQTRLEKTAAGVVKGKIAFMSPEQARGDVLDHRSDIFSLGTVMYLAITGKLPFQAATAVETMVRIQSAQFAPSERVKPDIHPEISRIIARAMKLEPDERYQSADDMLVDVEKVMRSSLTAVGQTELKGWLDALGERDHVPPISRSQPDKSDQERDDDSLSGLVELGSSNIVAVSGQSKPLPKPQDSISSGTVRIRSFRRMALILILAGGGFVAATHFSGWFDSPVAGGPALIAPAPEHTVADASLSVAELLPKPAESDAGAGSIIEAAVAEATDASVVAEEPLAATESTDAGVASVEQEVAPEEEELLAKSAVANPSEVVIEEPVPAKPLPKPDSKKPQPAKSAVAVAPAKAVAPKDATVSVMVNSQPTGAVVRVGSKVFGRTPIPLRFRTGILFEVTFVKAGYQRTSKRILVENRKNQRLTAYLKKASPKRRSR